MRAQVRHRSGENAALPSSRSLSSRAWIGFNYHELGWLLRILDFALVVGLSTACGIAYHLFAFGSAGDVQTFMGAGFVVGALFVTCQTATGLYDPLSLIERNRPVARLASIWILVFAFFATAAFLLKITDNLSRGTMILWFLSGLIVLAGTREIAVHLISQGLANGTLRARRAVAIGDREELSESELGHLFRHAGYQVSQFFTAPDNHSDQPHSDHSAEWAAVAEEVRRCVRGGDVAEVLICLNWRDKKRIDALVSMLRVVPLPVRLVPDHQLRQYLPDLLQRTGAPGIEVQRAPLTRTERIVKRALDLACAGLGLVMLLPLLTAVALAIKLDSRGPVLFRQYRTGFNGRTFSIYKFRTMAALENGAVIRQASRCDGRVTRVGRWLRRTSIDELPQLLNVLAGHMSLVGPRPHAVVHDDHYSKLIADYAMRQHVRPGITGWAQVNGFRGETAEVDLMRRRVEHDLWYIGNWSIRLDLAIIARTCVQVLTAADAY
jgi:Undecaprenyl-phosphate glucose phosphotransferase